MVRKSRRYLEYKFQIDAFTPDTIPMARLAEYLTDLANVLGEQQSVHLEKIVEGSTVPVLRVDWEAEPKIRDRIQAIKTDEAPEEAIRAARQINRRLAEDNARGFLIDPHGTKLVKFPGRELASSLKFGPINQEGEVQGVPIKIGGEHDPVPVHLEDGKSKVIVMARRSLAKEIAPYLFTAVVRVQGTGRWLRHPDGAWELLEFKASTFKLVEDGDLREDIERLRRIDAGWKHTANNDPLAELERIKHGEKPQ